MRPPTLQLSLRMLRWLSAVAAASTASAAQAEVTFSILPMLSQSHDRSFPLAISADGRYAVGNSGTVAFRQAAKWDLTTNSPVQLPGLAASTFDSATGLSGDGTIVSGVSANRPARWLGPGAAAAIFTDTRTGQGVAVSYDGSTVAGFAQGATANRAFRFRNNVTQDLGTLPGGVTSQALGVSGDGRTIVGTGSSSDGARAWSWNESDALMTSLGTLPGHISSAANAISRNSTTIVGFSNETSGFTEQPVRWESGVIHPLTIPAGATLGRARAVSGDGSIIVGHAGTDPLFDIRPMVWIAGGTPIDLSAWLTGLGFNLGGMSLTSATGTSDNGMVIVGLGTNALGQSQGWTATIPAPTPVWALAFTAAYAAPRRRRPRRFHIRAEPRRTTPLCLHSRQSSPYSQA